MIEAVAPSPTFTKTNTSTYTTGLPLHGWSTANISTHILGDFLVGSLVVGYPTATGTQFFLRRVLAVAQLNLRDRRVLPDPQGTHDRRVVLDKRGLLGRPGDRLGQRWALASSSRDALLSGRNPTNRWTR